MSAQNDRKAGGKSSDASDSNAGGTNDEPVFLLEELYPDASKLFSAAVVPKADAPGAVVVFDTNALLLPYHIAPHDLTALSKVLNDLANANRLFVPARVAREFIKNRDKKLADMLKALKDKTSRVQLPEQKLSPLLDGIEGYEEMSAAARDLVFAWKAYRTAQEKIIGRMREWRGNDPVSLVYDAVLRDGRIIDIDDEKETLQREWDKRRSNLVPPGYKDSGKPDTGIGDFLIWMTILKLGREQKKDLIFITGEEKADWFVRSDNERIYPRPELVDEYRRASDGRNIRLSTLAELLEEMQAPADVVKEVKSAELQANNAVQMAASASTVSVRVRTRPRRAHVVSFDYSTSDGQTSVLNSGISVDLRFAKASKERIHLYRSGSTVRIARVKNAEAGTAVFIDSYDTSSRSYAIEVGEVFIAENDQGEILVGRITGIMDDTRGDDGDRVEFLYSTFRKDETPVAP